MSVTRTATGRRGSTIAAHGLRVELPARWEGRLFLRDAAVAGWAGEAVHAVLHLANFPLPPGRGDFGTGAVETMRAGDAFVALLEYGAAEVGTALFAARGVPRPHPRDFAPNALQRPLPGQLGYQRFFTEHGRAFCLYVVLASGAGADVLVREVRAVLDSVAFEGRDRVRT